MTSGHLTPTAAPALVLYGQDLARALGVASPSAALRIVKRSGIPFVRIGRRVGVRVAALDEWLRAGEQRTEARPVAPFVPQAPEWARSLLRRGRGPAQGRGRP
jgi:hypothetical protein